MNALAKLNKEEWEKFLSNADIEEWSRWYHLWKDEVLQVFITDDDRYHLLGAARDSWEKVFRDGDLQHKTYVFSNFMCYAGPLDIMAKRLEGDETRDY